MAIPSQPTTSPLIHPTFDPESHFEKVASTYEESAPVMKEIASHLIALSPPLTPHSTIHDNAAGPGIITGEILRLPQFTNGNYPTIHATDCSPAMIRALEARSVREGWPTKPGVVTAHVMDSMDLSSFSADTFTHTYMGSAIFIVPDPLKAIAEIKRTLQPGGMALVTTFEKQEFMEVFQDVQRAVRPEEEMWKGPLPAEWLTEGKLRAVMEGGGFEGENLEVRRFSVWMTGEVWSTPGSKLLKEAFTRSVTQGWSEGETARFEERLTLDLESERVRSRRFEMKVLAALATK